MTIETYRESELKAYRSKTDLMVDIWSLMYNEPNYNNKSRAEYRLDHLQKAAGYKGFNTDRNKVIRSITNVPAAFFSPRTHF